MRLLPVENRFFGGNIGVTGLLTGADVARRARRRARRATATSCPTSRCRAVASSTARRAAELPRAVEIVPTDGASLVAARRAMTMTTRRCGRELPVVAIVGRPNVGKSTLVNRIVGRRAAIVEERPGVTRDRKEFVAEWNGRGFRIVDTGGWLAPGETGLTGEESALAAKVSEQAEEAIRAADLVVLVVDVTTGITDEDARVAQVLQQRGSVPVVAGGRTRSTTSAARPTSGSSRVSGSVSPCRCRRSTAACRASCSTRSSPSCPPEPEDSERDARRRDENDGIFSIAIVGRPNVGKSTLFNRLVGEDRAVVHDMPGTTRDAIDTVVETDDGPLRFVDTAGLRRKSRIDEPTEYYSLVRALEAIDRADAALFLIDATEGVTHQDQRLAERIDAAGTAVVIVLNKWDLLDAEAASEGALAGRATSSASSRYAPVLPISALTGRRVHQLLPALREAEAAYHQRIPTAALNRVLRDAQAAHPPPVEKRHRPRILYATQGATDPPTFTLFATRTAAAQYLRYLERKLREAFDLGPTPDQDPGSSPGGVKDICVLT